MEFKDVENAPTDQKRHKIRITLTSKNIKSLESGKIYFHYYNIYISMLP